MKYAGDRGRRLAKLCSRPEAWMTSRGGSLNPEYLLHDLSNRAQRVELPPLHLAEEALELLVPPDGALEMRFRPRAGDREHLAGEMLGAAALQEPFVLQVGAVLLDLFPQLGDA